MAILSTSQWLQIADDTNMDNVDCESVILALMFDTDSRIRDCDDAFSRIIDSMNRDTIFAHTTELYFHLP